MIDPVNQDFKFTTEYLNGRFVSLVIETLRYRSVKMCETLMERRTKMSAKMERIENCVYDKYCQNIEKTDKGMMCVLSLLDECKRQNIKGAAVTH